MGDDGRAVTFGDAPVDAIVGVAAEVARRNARQPGATVIAADRVEQRVPSSVRLEQVRQSAVGLAFRQRVRAFVQRPQRCAHFVRFVRRQARLRRRARPRRRRTVDRTALRRGDRRPRIALGRMQPAATEINGKAARFDRPGAAAEPVARLEDQRLDAGVAEPPRCADPRRPAADHRNLDVAARHAALLVEQDHTATAPAALPCHSGRGPSRSSISEGAFMEVLAWVRPQQSAIRTARVALRDAASCHCTTMLR